MSPDRLDEVVASTRVLVCVGPGGVGKTSSSAAIALHAARQGRRALVLTIDPARRLANALGLPEMGNEERFVDAAAFGRVGLSAPRGKLTAMMLDIKQTWDEVITRYHPDPERKAKLLSNRLYEALSTALAGSQEYMAMEKLFELSHRKHDPLDLVVLDTPPAANAVDFLEAPSRMIDALDNDATRWLLEPYTTRGRITSKLFDAGSSFFIRTISRLTGAELIDDLAELLSSFSAMFDGFRERAKAVRSLLEANDTRFVVVTSPRGAALLEGRRFRDRLVERRVNVAAMVLNRATVDPFHPAASYGVLARGGQGTGSQGTGWHGTAVHGPPTAGRLGGATPTHEASPRAAAVRADDREVSETEREEAAVVNGAVAAVGGSALLASRLVSAAHDARDQAAAERESADALRAHVEVPVAVAPELPRDIHDLLGLEALRGYLFRA